MPLSLREQEEDLQEMRVFSAAPPANPGTPLSKYLEKDLRSQLEDAKKRYAKEWISRVD